MASSDAITIDEFKTALSRYPETIKKFSDAEKPSPTTLEQLDQFRYIDAPSEFSKKTGNVLKAEHIQKLTAWKLRHGKYRPTLTKLVASNTDEDVAKATEEAFAHYGKSPNDITGTLNLLSKPLKGVGPATASLYLAIHDPTRIIFFSDEAYKWLINDSKLKYDVKEYEALHEATQRFTEKLGVTPIEVEKVAFVLIKGAEAVKESKEPKEPSGRGRGRPAGSTNAKKNSSQPTRKSERQPQSITPSASDDGAVKRRGRPAQSASKSASSSAGPNKRGRPAKNTSSSASEDAPAKKRGRPPGNKVDKDGEASSSSAGKKRGRPAGSTKDNSAKKMKV